MAAVPTPWHLGHVGAPAAHAAGWTGKGVLVGVLDTGIDATHPEFKGKTIQFAEFDTDGLRIPGPARDAGSHGTHVCALVAGRSVGVAPDASLAVAAVLTGLNAYGQNVGRLAQITSGLNWLLTTMFRGGGGDPGVDIVNASLGGVGMNDYLYAPLLTARSAPGTLMVAAIGNAGTLGAGHHGSPGNYDIVIGVGATDSSDVLAAFSDWGQAKQPSGKVVGKPDLVAPGVGVWSAFPGGGYVADDGTSMASPIVCGAAALALQRQPALSTGVAQLQARIESLTVALADPRAGRGRLDLGGL
jgi:subtilisin family serine protease